MSVEAVVVFNYSQPFYTLPGHVWQDILRFGMPVSQDNGSGFANARKQYALISKPIASIVRTDTWMWSDLRLGSGVPLESLELAISRSGSAPLTVSLAFTDLDYDSAHPLTEASFAKIRAILERLAPLSDQFHSFGLTTEHPLVYTCVQGFFANRTASALRELDIDFWYMMQFGGFPPLDPINAAPLHPRTWFGDAYQSLSVLRVTSANLRWHTPHAFVNLTKLEVVDIIQHPSFTWDIFASILATSTSLVHFRLGNIVPFDVPTYGIITSTSVTSFDISFDEQGEMAHFASHLVFPALTTLIYRMDECEFLPPALLLGDMLSQITHFVFHGTARDTPVMIKMFSLMRRVTELDLSNAKGYPLRVLYQHLATLILDRARPALYPPVHTLHLRFADHECLRLVLLMYKASYNSDGQTMDVKKVRLESDGLQIAILPWFRDNVDDFIISSTFISSLHLHLESMYEPLAEYNFSTSSASVYLLRRMADAGVPAVLEDPANLPSPILQIASNLPNELLTAILDESCSADGPCNIDKWIAHRDVLRLVSRDVLRYVDGKELFWSRILLSPRNIGRFPLYVQAARSALLHVTVRFPDSLDDDVEADSPLRDRIDIIRESIITYVADELHRCAGLSIQAMSHQGADFLLFGLEGSYARRLQYISAGFAVHEFFDCEDTDFVGYTFASAPAFGVPFTPATALSIIPSSQRLSSVTYNSSTSSSCVIRQARDQELEWQSVMNIIDPRGYLSSLVLRDVMWTEGPISIRAPYPLSTLTSLDVAFCGNVAMADFVTHLCLPMLHTLVFRFCTTDDLILVSKCGALLVTARDIRLVAEPSFHPPSTFSAGLISLFGRFHRAHSLDLSVGHPVFLSSFISASSERSLGRDINWHACPVLERLSLSSNVLSQARSLVSVRASVGYPVLGYVGFSGVDFTDFVNLYI
ncbi:hypothetical protein C8R43DRAFT_1138245 [Mycena crocata]|nr:hypothetical protein C8R43DRAFT_1138245 [Mycena crocata]